MSTPIWFSCAGLTFQVECDDSETEFLVSENFGTGEAHCAPAVRYRVSKTGGRFLIGEPESVTHEASTDSEFLYILEKAIILEVQKLRHTLYFVHGAALEFDERAILLAGDPGAGKSTLTWALLHHGFSYLSDELAPIDVPTLSVYPYPHAICLKREPPSPYSLPRGVLRGSQTIHIPVRQIPATALKQPRRIRSLFFVKYDPAATAPSITPVSSGEGAARLYSHTLNLLAHPGFGLEHAIAIARRCDCFILTSAAARATCEAIRDILIK